jgi:hypothetical protein
MFPKPLKVAAATAFLLTGALASAAPPAPWIFENAIPGYGLIPSGSNFSQPFTLGPIDLNNNSQVRFVGTFPGALCLITPGPIGTEPAVVLIPGANLNFPRAAITVDLNSDGYDEIVYSGSTNGSLFVLANQQDGTFTSTTYATGVPAAYQYLSTGDVNNDNNPDIVAATSGNPARISVLLGNGSGGLGTANTSFAPSGFLATVFTMDMNGDSWDDVGLDIANTTYVRLNDGTGVLNTAVAASDPLTVPLTAVFVDLDGDTFPDLATACSGTTDTIEVRYNDGSASFTQAPQSIVIPNSGFDRIGAADIDVDGKPELYYTTTVGEDSFLLRNLGSRTFSTSLQFFPAAPVADEAIHFADLDADGDRDIFYGDPDGLFYSVENLGGTTFQTYPDLSEENFLYFESGDAEGDGDIDLFGRLDNEVVIFRNDGSANFTQERVSLPGSALNITVRDFNGDGYLDFCATDSAVPSLNVSLSTGPTTFAAPITYPIASGFPQLAYAIELDGINGPDIFLMLFDSADQHVIYLNNGNGTFTPGAPINSISDAEGEVVDIDADGDEDLLLNDGSSPVILYSNGNGTLSAPFTLTPDRAYDVTTADFNRDGFLDIVSSRNNGGGISFWMGTGLNAWSSSFITYPGKGRAWDIEAPDLNADGWPDVLVTIREDQAFAYYENLRNGTFAAARHYYNPDRPFSTTTADFNGDGLIDAAFAAQCVTVQLSTIPYLTAITPVNLVTYDLILNEDVTGAVGPVTNFTLSGPGIGTLGVHPNSATLIDSTTIRLQWASGEADEDSTVTLTCSSETLIDSAGNPLAINLPLVEFLSASDPTSSATSPSGSITQAGSVLDVAWTGSDLGSDLDEVELFYTRNGGAVTSAGSHTASPIPFDTSTAGGDGTYTFYTVATDLAGNDEAAPATPDITVLFTQGTTVPDWGTLLD